MQKLWEVTCNGKTLPELKKALEGALRELEGGVSTKSSVQVTTPHFDPQEPGPVDDYVDESEISTHNNVAHINPAMNTSPSVYNNAELDSEGIPWNASVHASSKEKVANGTWRARRGVDKNALANYKNAHRGAVQQAPSQPVQQPPAPINNNFNQHQAPAPVVQQQQQTVQAPFQNTPPALPPQQVNHFGHTLQSFQDNFPVVLSHLITAGKINQDWINQVKTNFNVAEVWMLNNDQKAQMFKSFVDWGFIQQVG